MIETENLRPELQSEPSIDTRHRQMLAEIVVCCGARRVMEIGCASGYSTAALVELVKLGHVSDLTLCDIEFIERVLELGVGLPVHYHQRPSHEVLEGMIAANEVPDLIFVDGCHETKYIKRELELLEKLGPANLVAHDTGYWRTDEPGYRYEPGCRQFLHHYQSKPGWFTLTDAFHRPNEATQRGLTFATRIIGNYLACQPVFGRQPLAWGWNK